MRTAALLTLCCLVGSSLANRHLLQNLDLPTYQGTGLTITNVADAAATQTSPQSQAQPPPPPPQQDATQENTFIDTSSAPAPSVLTLPVTAVLAPQPSADALPPSIFLNTAPTPSTPVVLAPTPTEQLPVITAPTPAPVQLPVITAPTPAPVQLPVITAPAPAPALPVFAAPVPAPMVMASAPVPVPAPAPAPEPFPLCGVQPQCRLFLEDMLCCDSSGVVNNKQHLVMRLQCTHPVNYYPKCAAISGPSNLTAFSQFETTAWSSSHTVQVNFLDSYFGNATIDIEGPRKDANLSADCGLYISPCLFNGSLIEKVAPVAGISFSTLDSEDFLQVSSSVLDDVTNLDSLVMPNLYFPTACQQQNVGELDASFFAEDWATYSGGFQNVCNYTAFSDAMLAEAPISAASVKTSSLG